MLRNANYIYDNIIIADEINTTKKYCKKAQVGVDLSIREVRNFTGRGATLKNKTYASPTEPLGTYGLYQDDEGNTYNGYILRKGTYIIELNEGCRFGPNDTGYIILRSSLNRSGVSISSAVWDPGYTSQREDGIYPMSIRMTVENENGFFLEENARVAQLIVFESEDTTLYDGQWQGGQKVSKLVK